MRQFLASSFDLPSIVYFPLSFGCLLTILTIFDQAKGEKEIIVPNGRYDVFPIRERLCIVAEVTEQASGIKESSSDSSAFFTDVPVKLDCDLSPPFYRPQLPLIVTVIPNI